MANSQRPIISSIRVPGFPAMLAPSMAAYLGPTQSHIFQNISEATDEMVRRTVSKFITHGWKSLASTSGGDFETFSVAVMNPYLPVDMNNLGIKLGYGMDPTKPISKKNKPDSKTQAFLLTGGDFYTVNMIIPNHIVERWPRAKGEFEAQADYVRVIPPKDPRSNLYKVKIIEFKNGLTHLEMAEEEEAQMMKESEAITEWYASLGKKVEIERFYCPAAATNAQTYRTTHISPNVNFITVSALSKIIQVPLNRMMEFTQYRTLYTKALTEKLNEIEKRTIKFLETADKSTVLANLRTLTPQKLGLNTSNSGNLSSGRNYPTRRLNVVKYMVIRSTLLRKMRGNITDEERRQLDTKLKRVTQLILEIDKPANVAEQVLESSVRNSLKASLGGKAIRGNIKVDSVFEDWIIERKEYLEEKYSNLPEWPNDLTPSEIVRPISFSTNEKTLDDRLSSLFRKKTITHENINDAAKITARVQGKLSNNFKLYFNGKVRKLRNLANEGKVPVVKNQRRNISGLSYGTNTNSNNNEVTSFNTSAINAIIRKIKSNMTRFKQNPIPVFVELVQSHTNANIRRALNKRIANSGTNNGLKNAYNQWVAAK